MSTVHSLRDLAERGVQISTLPSLEVIHEDVVFEPPLDIDADLTLSQRLRVGAFSHLNGGFIKDVTIGRYCSFARDIQIGHGMHPTGWLSVSPLQYNGLNYRGWPEWIANQSGGPAAVTSIPFDWSSHTNIGNDVWLGNHVIVKDGITIGDGAIVGAGSVVTRDVPPYAIIAGSPARLIRMRFPDHIVEKLMALKWWKFNLAHLQDVSFNDVPRAIDQILDLQASGRLAPYQPDLLSLKPHEL